MNNRKNKVIQNTLMLYILNIAKLALPLITLPYLTRVLSVNSYGTVTYVRSIMTYMQLIVDFGFILSATKDIVRSGKNKIRMGKIIGDVILGKLFLSLAALTVLLIMIMKIRILNNNVLFSLLSFIPIVLSIFLFDFLFRGLEKMQVISIRYVIMKGTSTFLTFFVIKNDSDLLWLPILDIFGTIIAVIWVFIKFRKLCIPIQFEGFGKVRRAISDSNTYFISNIATTAFGALNTVIIGILLTRKETAYWSLVMQMVNAIQTMYIPITEGIYPQMVRSREFKLIKKVMLIFMPLVFIGCIMVYFLSPFALFVIGGVKYVHVDILLRTMIPVLLFSFPSMLFGWPVLGAIDRVKETTISTIVATIVQCSGLLLLIILGQFTLINIAILRGFTEFVLLTSRSVYCWRYRQEFSDYENGVI